MAPEALPPASLPPVAQPPIELRPVEANHHLLLTLLKWRRLILLSGLVLMVAAAAAVAMRAPSWSAAAKILIKGGQDALPIAGLPDASRRAATAEVLETEAELFASQVVLAPVARALREARGEPVDEADLAGDVRTLRSNLDVSQVPNTSLLQARYSAPAAEEAEHVLRRIVDSYVNQHALAYGSTSLTAFFEGETDRAATQLKSLEDRLQRWQQTHDIVAVHDQIAAQVAAVGEFQGGVRRTEVEIEALRAQIEKLERDVAALPEKAVISRENVANPLVARLKSDLAVEEAALRDGRREPLVERLRLDIATAEVAVRDAANNPLVTRIKGDLVTAQIALNDLRQRYTDEDRRIQEKLDHIRRLEDELRAAEREATAVAQERLEGLRRELARAERDAEAQTRARIATLRSQLAEAERDGDAFAREMVAPNPLREVLLRDQAAARARLSALISQRDTMRQQLDTARQALARLQEQRIEFDRLSRDLELARAVYMQNSKRLDDARLAAGLERHQLTNIALIEPPHASGSSKSPRQIALVALLGAAVGLGLGVVAAFALEFFNWSLRTADEVEFYLHVPVVAAVPAIDSPAGRRALPPPGRAGRPSPEGVTP